MPLIIFIMHDNAVTNVFPSQAYHSPVKSAYIVSINTIYFQRISLIIQNLAGRRMCSKYQGVATATIQNNDLITRLNMNTKAILSAVGIAAVLASPAMAQPRHQTQSPAPASAPAQTVYAPDVPVPTHYGAVNPDSQLGSERN
jgi:hypothetical protein